MTARPHNERGAATTETVLTVPVVMLLVLLVVQFGLWFHASHLAEAAAQEGVRAARVSGGTAQAGHDRASGFLIAHATSLLDNATVEATRADDITRVEVRGTLASIVPGVHLPVRAGAQSPVERFRADDR